MSLDPSIDLGVDGLDEGPDDVETVVTTWLAPLLPNGQVATARLSDDPLPFVVVNHLDGTYREDVQSADEVVSIHCLYPKGLGNANKRFAGQFADIVDRRMLLLGRYLEPVLVNGRPTDLEYVEVFSRMRWEPYGDDQILRKVGRYRIGLGSAKLS